MFKKGLFASMFVFILVNVSTAQFDFTITARAKYQKADAKALEFAADAQALFCMSSKINPEGKALMWLFGYHSAQKDTAALVPVSFIGAMEPILIPLKLDSLLNSFDLDSILNQHDFAALDSIMTMLDSIPRFSLSPLGEEWIDSDVAIDIAEKNGGSQFRNEHSNTIISAVISNFLYGEKVIKSWAVIYSDTTNRAVFMIGIDAISGEIIENPVAVKPAVSSSADICSSYHLYANYPNPFNCETVIYYELPEAALISLDIYDLTGRKVRRLNHSFQSAGIYKLKWNGRNDQGQAVASGVYLYQLSTGEQLLTKKMLFTK